MDHSTVTHSEFTQKHAEKLNPNVTHYASSDIFGSREHSFEGRTWTQDEFTPKLGEKASIMKPLGELQIDTAGNCFKRP